jgi:hypothetical protein
VGALVDAIDRRLADVGNRAGLIRAIGGRLERGELSGKGKATASRRDVDRLLLGRLVATASPGELARLRPLAARLAEIDRAAQTRHPGKM